MKFLIVDGNNLMYQMFHGVPSRIKNREGKAVHGAVGFIGSLIKCMKVINPTHVIIIFDGKVSGIRNKVYQGYKRNRKKGCGNLENENPFSQMPEIKRMLDYMKVSYLQVDGIEADDLIASYTIGYRDQLEVIIFSSDKDFFQLIGPSVKVYSYRAKQFEQYDTEKIIEEYHVEPHQLVDLFSLQGDASDNIRGIPRIGNKIAEDLIREYGSIEGLIHHCDTLASTSLEKLISKNKDKLYMNYQLICLKGRLSDSLKLEELAYHIELMEPMSRILLEAEIYYK